MSSDLTDDIDELTRRVNRLCDRGSWDAVLDLRDDCRAAAARGKQLWAVASYCEYRVALDGPGRLAGEVLVPESGRFALGPLSEVAAVNHTWAELAPFTDGGPVAALAAHERVLRGDDLSRTDVPARDVCEVPLVLQPWERPYALATYEAEKASFPSPRPATLAPGELPVGQPAVTQDRDALEALTAITSAWATESNGRVDVVAVEGTAIDAVGALGVPSARAAPVAGADALGLLAWTAASGGAHGRRRGMAPGRFAAWWATVACAGLLDEWPVSPDRVGALVTDRLEWLAWEPRGAPTGWALRLAIADPDRHVAYAINATDRD